MSEKAIRIGILGCSDIARRKFIPAVMHSQQATLVALASRELDKAESLLPPGFPLLLMSYEEMVCSPHIDLIYLSLPNHLHESWSIAALERGKHVICEKPLGLDVASVSRMLDMADRHSRLLFENLMYLQHPQHREVKSIISSGRIGRVLSLHTEFAFPGPPHGDFRLNPTMGGGAFNDMNRYPLSAALFFLKGKQHHFISGNRVEQNGLNLEFMAESETDAGEKFSFLTAFGKPYRSFYEIKGERGSIRVERAYTTPADMANMVSVMIDGRDESFIATSCDHFLSTIEHICSLIRSGVWTEEHERGRALAALADMFQEKCIQEKK